MKEILGCYCNRLVQILRVLMSGKYQMHIATCWFRVTDAEQPLVVDMSDANFTIEWDPT